MTEKEIRKSLSGFKGIQSIREIELLRLLDEKDAQIAALVAPPAQPTAQASAEPVICSPFSGMDEPWSAETMAEFDAALAPYETAQASAEPKINDALHRIASEFRNSPEVPSDLSLRMYQIASIALGGRIASEVAQASAEPALFSSYKMDDGSTVAEFLGHPMRVVLIVDDDGFHVMWRESGENKSMIVPAASAAPLVSADPLQELADQAQALDMGYGPNACQACGKSASAAPVVPDGREAFEHWANELAGPFPFDFSLDEFGNYKSQMLFHAFIGWQAAQHRTVCDGHDYQRQNPTAYVHESVARKIIGDREELRAQLEEIATAKNGTATDEQFARHLQWMAADAIGMDRPVTAQVAPAAIAKAEQVAQASAEPVVWMVNGRFIRFKESAVLEQNAMGGEIIPLYAAPAASAAPVVPEVSAGGHDVLAERQRQMSVEGWTPEHDDEHADGSLVDAAITYAMAACAEPADRAVIESFGFVGLRSKIQVKWPASWCSTWFKPKSRRRDLVRAAALLIAEIDRIDRAAAAFAAAPKEPTT